MPIPYQLDPFQMIVYLPNKLTSTMNFTSSVTADLNLSYPNGILVPSEPSYSSSDLGARDVRWNSAGTSIAWAHRIGPDGTTPKVSIYNFSGGSLTKVGDLNTAIGIQQPTYATSIDWNSTGSRLAVLDQYGAKLYSRSGSTFTNLYANTNSENSEARIRYCYNGTRIACGRRIYNATDLSLVHSFTGQKTAWANNGVVVVANSSDYVNTSPITAWTTTNGTTFTQESFPNLPKYGYTELNYGYVYDIAMNPAGNIVAIAVSHGGYSPAGYLYQRNGPGSWSLLATIRSDPEQTNQTGSGWNHMSCSWSRDGSKVAFGRFTYVDTPNSVYIYNSSGSLLQKVGTGYQPLGVDIHPNNAYLGVAIYNTKPFFRVFDI